MSGYLICTIHKNEAFTSECPECLRIKLQESNRLNDELKAELKKAPLKRLQEASSKLEVYRDAIQKIAPFCKVKYGMSEDAVEAVEKAITLADKRKDVVVLTQAPRRVCWFAEVNQESKAACGACKDLTWPRWMTDEGILTDDPSAAKSWETREQAEAFCLQGNMRHWHLYPTEHMFVS